MAAPRRKVDTAIYFPLNQTKLLIQLAEETGQKLETVDIQALKDMEDQVISLNGMLDRFHEELVRKSTLLRQASQDMNDYLQGPQGVEPGKMQEKMEAIRQELKSIQSIMPKEEQSKSPQKQDSTSSREMADDRLWHQVEESILASAAMVNLRVSYNVLDSRLKLCLLCLSIFPEKAVIKKRLLIHWWIGEGFITRLHGKTAEEEGEEIFNQLIDKGLIRQRYKDTNQESIPTPLCTVHPWIRRMLVTVATGAQFLNFDPAGEIIHGYCQPNQSHRVCLVAGNEGSLSLSLPDNAGDVLTIFNIDHKYIFLHPDDLKKTGSLAILHLGRWRRSARYHIEVENEEFLNALQELKHLRYLSLRGISRITALPDSIVKCINLEILDLKACHNLERLPGDISVLTKVSHLDISECYLLERMPKGIDKLSSLEALKGLVIGGTAKNDYELEDLAHLKRLRRLSIVIKSMAAEEQLTALTKMTSLLALTITWINPQEKTETAPAKTALTFVSKVEKLDLWCFPRKKWPEWLRPSNMEALKKLYIRGGPLESLGSDKPWKVEILRLKYLKGLIIDEQQRSEYFPHLVHFENNHIAKSKEEKAGQMG